jgi:hypothetical protein
MLEVKAVPQSCIPLRPDWFAYCFIHEKFVAGTKSIYTTSLRLLFQHVLSLMLQAMGTIDPDFIANCKIFT